MTVEKDDTHESPHDAPDAAASVGHGIDQPTATLSRAPTQASEPQASPSFDPQDGLPGYVVTRRLGVGSYGQVWQAVRVGAGQDVAIKIFTSPGRLDWRYLQREVDRLLRVAEHPHIVTLLDANLQNEPPFYVMALLRSGSLANLCREDGPPADVERAALWFEQLVRALDFAHTKGLLHCDIKPANVLLDEEDNVRLVDFGQSHLQGEAARAVGTLNYMAPEQAVVASAHEAPPDPSVGWDIYGLGATMYALLTGQPPHSHSDLKETLTQLPDIHERLSQYRQHVLDTPFTPVRRLNPRVDRDLAAIVEHCLAPDPQQRYHHIAEIAGDLRRRRQHRPLRCHRPTAGYVFRRFLIRNLSVVIITVGAILALATLSVTFYMTGEAQLRRLRDDVDHAVRLLKEEQVRHDETKLQADQREAELLNTIQDLQRQDD
jgi:serine/threonine protein kinase